MQFSDLTDACFDLRQKKLELRFRIFCNVFNQPFFAILSQLHAVSIFKNTKGSMVAHSGQVYLTFDPHFFIVSVFAKLKILGNSLVAIEAADKTLCESLE